MKISVSGSAGTGKTSFANAAAVRCGCPVVPETYDDFFDESYDFVQPASRLQQRIFETLEKKNALENEQADFIADRCPVDLFNLWLSRGFANDESKTADLYNRCRSYVRKYDYIVVLPWGALPLTQLDGPIPRRRVMNSWIQLYNHSAVIGLLQQWVAPLVQIPVPFAVTAIGARVDFVLRAMKRRKNTGPKQGYPRG